MYKVINKETNQTIGIYDKATRNQIIQEMTKDATKFELDDNGNVLFYVNRRDNTIKINDMFYLDTDKDELVLSKDLIIAAHSMLIKDETKPNSYIARLSKRGISINISVDLNITDDN